MSLKWSKVKIITDINANMCCIELEMGRQEMTRVLVERCGDANLLEADGEIETLTMFGSWRRECYTRLDLVDVLYMCSS